MTGQIERAAQGSAFGIPGGVKHTTHPCLYQSSGAHRAWFEGDHQGAVVESPVALNERGLAEGDQLGMAERVLIPVPAVAPPADAAPAPIENDGGNRDLPALATAGGLTEQPGHPQPDHPQPDHGPRGFQPLGAGRLWPACPIVVHTVRFSASRQGE